MFCREHVAQLRDHVDEVRRRGAELVAVGNGKVSQAAAFAEEQELSFPLLTDPGRRAFRAAGLRRGVGATFSLGTLRNSARSMKGGFRQGTVQGDAWQQGGTFVLAPGNQTLFAHIDREGGDHPDPAHWLAALPG